MEIQRFAKAFIELQKARQKADYAFEGAYFQREVLVVIDTVEDAMDRFEQADVRRSFAVHALFKRHQL